MENGFIILHRKIMEWEWYNDINTFKVFIHFLLKANHKEEYWQGIKIERGQFISGLYSLKNDLKNLSTKQIRTSITKLKRTGELASKSTNKFTLFTLINYSKYQNKEKEISKETAIKRASKGQAKGKQRATNNNDNNDNKENNTLGETSSPEFNSSVYIEQLISSKQKHISLIGRYFKKTFFNPPSLKAAQAEIKRWVRTASTLVEYPTEKIEQAVGTCESSEHLYKIWNLGTVLKEIVKL